MSGVLQSPATFDEQVALGYIKQTMREVCSHRRYLLKVVLAGRARWMETATRSFRGIRAIDANALDLMWQYFVARAYHAGQTTAQLKNELGVLLEQQELLKAANQPYKPDDIVKLSDDGQHQEITLDLKGVALQSD
jgi:hypothetical protein